jgi:ribosomal protein L30E
MMWYFEIGLCLSKQLTVFATDLKLTPFSCFPDNVDLGTACGKYFRVCCLSIIDPGKWLLHITGQFDVLIKIWI